MTETLDNAVTSYEELPPDMQAIHNVLLDDVRRLNDELKKRFGRPCELVLFADFYKGDADDLKRDRTLLVSTKEPAKAIFDVAFFITQFLEASERALQEATAGD